MFQSTPRVGARGDVIDYVGTAVTQGFQSTPRVGARGDMVIVEVGTIPRRFNPHLELVLEVT